MWAGALASGVRVLGSSVVILGVAHVAILVRDYDAALAFYRDTLGFRVVEDTQLATKRWIRLAGPGGRGSELLLSRAVDDNQAARVGDQAGGRVLLFLHTNDLDADYARLTEAGVVFTEPPRSESYGRVAVFLDLYGNRIDLIEPSA